MKKALLALVSVVVLLGLGLGVLLVMPAKMRPASSEKIEATPERLERGKYLVSHVTSCGACHSDYAIDVYGMPPKPGSFGAGGFCFDQSNAGVPGVICAQNITPDPETGIGSWSDGEIMRAMREGVSKDGRVLFPMMPYFNFKNLGDDDAKAIVAYLRTIPAIKKDTTDGHIDFPVSLFVKLGIQPLDGPVKSPDPKDTVAYGEYLATISGCIECHTPHDEQMRPLPGRLLSGGREFKLGELHELSANLTPHPTGMGARDKASFIALFKSFSDRAAFEAEKVAPKDNTIMPWLEYAGMTEPDLGAIYDYLKSVPAVDHAFERRPPPKVTPTAVVEGVAPVTADGVTPPPAQ